MSKKWHILPLFRHAVLFRSNTLTFCSPSALALGVNVQWRQIQEGLIEAWWIIFPGGSNIHTSFHTLSAGPISGNRGHKRQDVKQSIRDDINLGIADLVIAIRVSDGSQLDVSSLDRGE